MKRRTQILIATAVVVAILNALFCRDRTWNTIFYFISFTLAFGGIIMFCQWEGEHSVNYHKLNDKCQKQAEEIKQNAG